eukprot:GCRY01001316.1.p1 GENE.GCRY01001316.1~~GCRY01001316.1.p1  ORF type:complete len:509 (+),score=118.16 GCRY01001316.1:146-1672(+)
MLRSFSSVVSCCGGMKSLVRTFSSYKKVLNAETINKNLVNCEYAVRGPVAIRSQELQVELAEGACSHPFEKVIPCNIGNPHAVGQKPLTYPRQVLSCLEYPEILKNPAKNQIFPSDVLERAETFMKINSSGLGSYSESKGIRSIRFNVADFIEKRDGFACNPEHIYLSGGASPSIQRVLGALISSSKDGVMTPIPQYPLYSGTIVLSGGSLCPYNLKETVEGWKLEESELQKSLEDARKNGVDVKALVVINPGNPTGHTLTRDNIDHLIKFCMENNLMILADEVYQENIYSDKLPFTSFKKAVKEMESKDARAKDLELISFHSASKGLHGECGHRGGYMELHNIDDYVVEMLTKRASLSLCSNVAGQVMIDCMVRPPQPGSPSYELYHEETTTLLASLKRRAAMLHESLNTMAGVSCAPTTGAMYAFPRVDIPNKAIAEAKRQGVAPDFLYCMEMLNNTGICVIPGSGFGQEEDTYHYRITILPQEKDFASFLGRMQKQHDAFMKTYA